MAIVPVLIGFQIRLPKVTKIDGYDLTQDSESGMTNIAFAQELVACCLYSAGKTEDEVADLILKYIAL